MRRNLRAADAAGECCRVSRSANGLAAPGRCEQCERPPLSPLSFPPQRAGGLGWGRPTLPRSIVSGTRLDPAVAGRRLLALPEWRLCLQPVDQEKAGCEGRLSVRRCRGNKHDPIAGFEPAVAMDYQHRVERPPTVRLGLDFGELSLGHAGIMFEGQRGDAVTAAHIADQPDKARDPAYPGIAGNEPFEFRADIKILALYPNHRLSLR